MTERHDPEAAARHARSNPRKGLPHHLRCDWMRGDERCSREDGHIGEHKYSSAPTTEVRL